MDVFGFRSLYFAMVFLQLMAVYLVVVLCASIFAVRPIIATIPIHCLMVVSLVGVGGCVCFLGCIIVGCFGGLASLCMA